MPHATRARPTALPAGLTGHIKGWLDIDGRFFVGPRYIRLLEGIDATGTIRAACRGTRMSYRTCLNRIRQMEQALGRPLVVTSRGGRARGRAELTGEARRLIRLYRTWRARLDRASDGAFATARKELRRLGGGGAAR